jgi:hypothetical protein
VPETLNDWRAAAPGKDYEVRAGNDEQRIALGQANHVFGQMLRGTARTGVGVVQTPKIIVRSVSHCYLLEATG